MCGPPRWSRGYETGPKTGKLSLLNLQTARKMGVNGHPEIALASWNARLPEPAGKGSSRSRTNSAVYPKGCPNSSKDATVRDVRFARE